MDYKNRQTNYLRSASIHDVNYNDSKEPVIIERGEGASLIDINGHKTIDLSDITAIIGHGHKRYVDTISKAVSEIIVDKGTTNKYKVELIEKLIKITPKNLNKVFFATSGSEIIECAVKVARRYTNRHEILSFWGGIHGRTYGAMSINGISRRKSNFGPLMPGCIHAPYPYCYRCPFDKKPESCNHFCIKFIDRILDAESTNDIAALIVEPYLGVGGIIFPPEGYMVKLERWANERNIIFILDEVQSCLGRTGEMFSYQHENLNPDLLCLGKGLGGGISIGALLMEDSYADSLRVGELSGGSGGNPLACASALSVIEIIEKENIVENSKRIGEYLIKSLDEMKKKYSFIGDVRGQGLTIGIEFVKNRETKEPFNEIVPKLIDICYRRGIYLTGSMNIISIRPPLVITEKQAEQAVDILDKVLEEFNVI